MRYPDLHFLFPCFWATAQSFRLPNCPNIIYKLVAKLLWFKRFGRVTSMEFHSNMVVPCLDKRTSRGIRQETCSSESSSFQIFFPVISDEGYSVCVHVNVHVCSRVCMYLCIRYYLYIKYFSHYYNVQSQISAVQIFFFQNLLMLWNHYW